MGTQANRADDQAAGAGFDELIMQGVTKAAAFIDGAHGMASLDFLPHPLHEARNGKTHGGFGMLMIALDGGGDLFEIHVQAEFEHRFQWGIDL